MTGWNVSVPKNAKGRGVGPSNRSAALQWGKVVVLDEEKDHGQARSGALPAKQKQCSPRCNMAVGLFRVSASRKRPAKSSSDKRYRNTGDGHAARTYQHRLLRKTVVGEVPQAGRIAPTALLKKSLRNENISLQD